MQKLLLRRREVCDLLGVDCQMVRKMVQCGVLNQIFLVPGGRAHYKRAEVEGLIKPGKKTEGS